MSDADQLRDKGLVFCMRPEHMQVSPVHGSHVDRHCSTCKRVVVIGASTVRAIDAGRVRDAIVCCCCADVHTPEEAAAKFSTTNTHGHQWRGRELRCECSMTWAEFRDELGVLDEEGNDRG